MPAIAWLVDRRTVNRRGQRPVTRTDSLLVDGDLSARSTSTDFTVTSYSASSTPGAVFSGADAGSSDPSPSSFHDGRAYTYVPSDNTFSIDEGSDRAHTVVVLSYEAWCAFVWELRSSFSLLYADEMPSPGAASGSWCAGSHPSGSPSTVRTLYDIDDPPPVEDRRGRALDLDRSFTLDDPEEEIAEFLHERRIRPSPRSHRQPTELEALRQPTSPPRWPRPDLTTGDRGGPPSAAGTCATGSTTSTISQSGSPRSARMNACSALPRWVAPSSAMPRDRLDGNSVVIKVPGAGEGLADLPWHRDCGMGGHPVKCPMLNVGIQLDPATAETGQLLMIAGSHRGTSRLPGSEGDRAAAGRTPCGRNRAT